MCTTESCTGHGGLEGKDVVGEAASTPDRTKEALPREAKQTKKGQKHNPGALRRNSKLLLNQMTWNLLCRALQGTLCFIRQPSEGGFGEGRCPINRSDGAALEDEWRGSFHWTGRGFSDCCSLFRFVFFSWCVFFFPNGLCGGHLHGDVGEESPPSGGVLLGLESGIGRGTGRATGGGGGSKKEPGILLWPLPFGCRQHK